MKEYPIKKREPMNVCICGHTELHHNLADVSVKEFVKYLLTSKFKFVKGSCQTCECHLFKHGHVITTSQEYWNHVPRVSNCEVCKP
jgi:hypothetical protein